MLTASGNDFNGPIHILKKIFSVVDFGFLLFWRAERDSPGFSPVGACNFRGTWENHSKVFVHTEQTYLFQINGSFLFLGIYSFWHFRSSEEWKFLCYEISIVSYDLESCMLLKRAQLMLDNCMGEQVALLTTLTNRAHYSCSRDKVRNLSWKTWQKISWDMDQPAAYKNAAGKFAYKGQGKLFSLPFATNGELGK